MSLPKGRGEKVKPYSVTFLDFGPLKKFSSHYRVHSQVVRREVNMNLPYCEGRKIDWHIVWLFKVLSPWKLRMRGDAGVR